MGRDYADVIRKLLAKAESTTFEEERDALVTQAQELMTKYAIDAALLEASGKASTDQIVTEQFASFTGTYRADMMLLGFGVLRVNNCRGVFMDCKWQKPQASVITATGYRSDLDRAKLLTASLELQCATAMAAWLKDSATKREVQANMARWGTGIQRTRRRMTRQFITSYVHEVNYRLSQAKRRAEQGAKAQHGEQVGIVLVDRKSRVDAAFDNLYSHLRTSRMRVAYGGEHAASSGRNAGARADTGSPRVGGSRSALGA